ncbi:response regulator transcription factor [Protaetiibacter mangrovi]|uniref:Response regulator transcription factor n=1 Tax=Protaetiibacter mangrovi TaxID=2970926 RepID=A0ABT1ZG32_9MICO|nr:response regulator transcription factor [Protaetiibacter mangrovi]MCS0499647.1 response regulator transcription factor [Protaetiibacter mangrovi]TPX05011.1 response regulator transcription factor [Schumannella luteola]
MSTPTAAPAPLTRPDGSPVRALVVDDEPSLGELIQMALRYEGWQVETATDGASALGKARTFQPDVVVLDIMMPGLDGLEVLRRLRAGGDEVAVLFLTAKDAVNDRVIGLTAGGDDYVTKPFSLEEVVARLRALLRRTGRAVTGYTDPVLRVGDLMLDEESYEVSRGGTPIDLTAKEFELLRYLMRNPRRVVSKLQILDRVWSYDFEGRSSIVEIYISYLRKKIEGDGMPPMIHTVRGVGYLIKPAS